MAQISCLKACMLLKDSNMYKPAVKKKKKKKG